MCAKCGCGCKAGKPAKGCKCTCATCKNAKKKSDAAQDAEVMKNMTPKQMLEFKKKDKKMDRNKPSRSEDEHMDKALAKRIEKEKK